MDNFDVKYKMINGVPVPIIRPMMKPVVNHVEKKLSDIPKVEKIRFGDGLIKSNLRLCHISSLRLCVKVMIHTN